MKFSREDSTKCKGFAILIMLFHHMYLEPARYAGYQIDFAPLTESMVNNIADFFKLCVGIYVFISAYGLTVSYAKWEKSDSSFVVYRIFKMMLIFYVIYIMTIFVSLVIGKDWNIYAAYGGKGKLIAIWYMFVDFLGLAKLFNTWWV